MDTGQRQAEEEGGGIGRGREGGWREGGGGGEGPRAIPQGGHDE